jgi:single-stranded DNA-specific DHH superfamily exonuclease
MKVNYNEARRFLESISPKDKIAIYTHIDLDGLTSGILFEEFCKKRKCDNVEVFFLNYGGQRISDCNPSRFNKFLIADLAPSAVAKDLELLSHGDTLYTDHHQEDLTNKIGREVLELRTTSEGFFPSSRTVFELTEKENKEKLWLATLGIFGDAGYLYPENSEFLERAYRKLGLTRDQLMEFTKKFGDVLVYFAQDLSVAKRELSSLQGLESITELARFYEPVEEEMSRLLRDYKQNRETEGEKVFYLLDTKFPSIKSPFINRISSTNSLKVFVFANLKDKLNISLSARNQSRNYDVSKMLDSLTRKLEGSNSGGHSFAAGGNIRTEDLGEFKKRFREYDLKNAEVKDGN